AQPKRRLEPKNGWPQSAPASKRVDRRRYTQKVEPSVAQHRSSTNQPLPVPLPSTPLDKTTLQTIAAGYTPCSLHALPVAPALHPSARILHLRAQSRRRNHRRHEDTLPNYPPTHGLP